MNKNTILLIVDVQKAFDDPKWGERNHPQAEENIENLLDVWRNRNWPIIHIQHTSDDLNSLFHPSNKGFEFKEMVKPLEEEKIIQKKVNSSFIGTPLETYLKENVCTTIVIVGLTTPHCVSTTTRMSGNLGFTTFLISDATAAFGMTDQKGVYYDAETIHNTTLATLHSEFATVWTTEKLLKTIFSRS